MDKYNEVTSVLHRVIIADFSLSSFGDVVRLYFDSMLLLESDDLIIYEHFFSNEFKIGMFVPVILPLFYGFLKTFKALASAEKEDSQ